ncbi:MAG: response regulator [Alphaproteobacteria bacterium]|nr:response regulator [Alphaproteobacteria bacterium]
MAYNFDKITAVIAEDNPHMRYLIKGILQAFGCKSIKEASNGQEAMQIINSSSADILICDWNMEPVNGIELVKAVRNTESSPNPFMPIIMLTGYSQHKRVIEARDAGVDEFVAKPISAKILYEHLKSVIEHPRSYVRSPTYFGPDRRRRQIPFNGEDRRKNTPDVEDAPRRKKDLSESDIMALLQTEEGEGESK